MRPVPLLIALVLSGCGLSSTLREARDVATPSVSGELTLQTAGGETLQWKPGACLSGEHEQFFGFILGAPPVVVRAVVDPLQGPGLRVTGLEGTDSLVFYPDQCEKLDLTLEPTGWRVNDFQDLSGALDVLCVRADGSRVEGTVDVRHCH
ncbi:MAG TPA: hypothetical protein VN493_21430 [Thermoanaerobaculia bacterium]|nr:hypothetical protein [Thermoanaerobaculia bacterium]